MYCRWNRKSRAKHSRLSHRKSQISHPYRTQTLSCKRLGIAACATFLHLIFNCRGDPRQTCRPYRIQQFSLASKMSVSRIRRNARLPGRLSQNYRIGSSNTRHFKSGCYERVAQIAMTKGLALLKGDVLFHCPFKEECTAERLIVDSIYFSVIAYVNGVHMMRYIAQWKVQNGRRIHLVRTRNQ